MWKKDQIWYLFQYSKLFTFRFRLSKFQQQRRERWLPAMYLRSCCDPGDRSSIAIHSELKVFGSELSQEMENGFDLGWWSIWLSLFKDIRWSKPQWKLHQVSSFYIARLPASLRELKDHSKASWRSLSCSHWAKLHKLSSNETEEIEKYVVGSVP